MYIVTRNSKTGRSLIIKDDTVQFKSHANDPFFLKKRKDAKEFIAKAGIPEFKNA